MREQVALLKKHGVQVDEDIVMGLDTDKEAWIETNRIVYEVKSSILSLKDKESDNIKKKLTKFNDTVADFRAEFLTEMPFKISEFTDITINEA